MTDQPENKKRLINWDFDELLFIARVSRVLPWAAPIYTAYLVTVYLMGAGVWLPIAIVEGLVVEGLGIVAVHTSLNTFEYNLAINGNTEEKPLPLWVSVAIMIFYYVVVILVVIFLDVTTEQRVINGLLSSLSLVSAALLASRSILLKREKTSRDEIESAAKQKEVKRLERAAIRAGADKQLLYIAQLEKETGVKLSQVAQDSAIESATKKATASKNGQPRPVAKKTPQVAQALTVDDLKGNRLKIYNLLQDNPALNNNEIGESIGISHQAVSNNRRVLVEHGLAELPERSPDK